ncbi:MAG: HlyD family efflux transporter periplasmic adaptor subunit [Syntrophomonas sp.]
MKNIKVVIVLTLLIISLTVVLLYFNYQNKHYIITDDAKVDTMLVKAAPQISGKILELSFEENQLVEENQIIGRLSDEALPVGANVDLIAIRAPIGGQIIKKLASPGEIGTPSSPVALLVNPDDLYITANIEEDKIERVKTGQKVDLTIDAFPGVYFKGQVDSVGSASASTFSLLPTQSSGNTFIKVTQRIPVKIRFQGKYKEKLLPGMNSVVKIYL